MIDYRRMDELMVEADLYVRELLMDFEEEMQGERANQFPQQEVANASSVPIGADLQEA